VRRSPSPRPSRPRESLPRCRTPWGTSTHPSARRSRRFPDISAPPSPFKKVAALQGPPGDWVRVDYRHVHHKVPPPVPSLQQDVCRAASVSGDVHLAVTWNSGLGEDLAEKGLGAKVPIPESRILARHSVVAEDVNRPQNKGHGLPAQSRAIFLYFIAGHITRQE